MTKRITLEEFHESQARWMAEGERERVEVINDQGKRVLLITSIAAEKRVPLWRRAFRWLARFALFVIAFSSLDACDLDRKAMEEMQRDRDLIRARADVCEETCDRVGLCVVRFEPLSGLSQTACVCGRCGDGQR